MLSSPWSRLRLNRGPHKNTHSPIFCYSLRKNSLYYTPCAKNAPFTKLYETFTSYRNFPKKATKKREQTLQIFCSLIFKVYEISLLIVLFGCCTHHNSCGCEYQSEDSEDESFLRNFDTGLRNLIKLLLGRIGSVVCGSRCRRCGKCG